MNMRVTTRLDWPFSNCKENILYGGNNLKVYIYWKKI